VVNRLDALEFLQAGCGVEFGGAEFQRLVLLALGGGEDDDFVAELGGKLDGEVPEAADTHDANAVAGLQALVDEWAPGKTRLSEIGTDRGEG
jgi:hypothetical protein